MPRIPLGWLAEHVVLPADATAESVAAALVRVGLEEEAVHPAAVSGPLVVGRVLEAVPEPQKNGKTIHWCQVDVGESDPATGEPSARGIVCGAQNFGPGDLVVVALPGAVLPGGFEIASRRTYGHVSDGMICSARELGLGEDHGGILLVSSLGLDAAPGDDAAALLGLGEEVLEINVTPDRGYCFSLRGVAREYAHATGAAFTDPAPPGSGSTSGGGAAGAVEPRDGRVPSGGAEGFAVLLDDRAPIHGVAGADRFVAQVVRGVDASRPSPVWMQRRLSQAGMRPLSLAVDVTNYVMLDLGQPLHAYDLGLLAEPIVVRRATPGETLRTLDGVDRPLHPEDLLVADSPGGEPGARVLALAGVMGGAGSQVTPETTDLLVEAAHFDPVTVARTARRHKLPSEAAKRFERGVDPALPPVAVARAVDLLVRYGGGVAEEARTDVDRTVGAAEIVLPLDLPARVVGVEYTLEECRGILEALGARVEPADGSLRVTPPSWRPDLASPVDLVEEIARLHGYDRIPSVLPAAPAGRGLTAVQRARRSVVRALAESGYVETLSYPFVGAAQLDALGIPEEDPRREAVRLANPLSEAQPLLRTDLLTTLLETVRRNVGRGLSDLAVFEVGLVTGGPTGVPAPRLPGAARPTVEQLAELHSAVPAQERRIAAVLTGLRERSGWWGAGRPADHTDAIAGAGLIADVLGVPLTSQAEPARAPWHPGRAARLLAPGGTVVGHAGELHPQVIERLDLPARTVAFEVSLDLLVAAAAGEPVQAREVSAFPVAKEDLALVVDDSVAAAEVEEAVRRGVRESAVGDVLEELRLFDVFTGPQVGEGRKSLAFSLRLRAADRTLTAEETAQVREAAVAEAARRTGATLRS